MLPCEQPKGIPTTKIVGDLRHQIVTRQGRLLFFGRQRRMCYADPAELRLGKHNIELSSRPESATAKPSDRSTIGSARIRDTLRRSTPTICYVGSDSDLCQWAFIPIPRTDWSGCSMADKGHCRISSILQLPPVYCCFARFCFSAIVANDFLMKSRYPVVPATE
jgi:hypothetical protein